MGDAKGSGWDTNVVIRLRDPKVFANAGPQFITSGTVLDPSGAPVFGVRLKVTGVASGELTAISDAKGNFNFRWQRQSYPAGFYASNPSLGIFLGRASLRASAEGEFGSLSEFVEWSNGAGGGNGTASRLLSSWGSEASSPSPRAAGEAFGCSGNLLETEDRQPRR